MARFLALLALLLISAEGSAPARAAARPRLYGLKKIAVGVSADPEGDLNAPSLRSSIESKLRAAGIRVDSGSRSRLNIVIGLSAIRTDQGVGLGYAYSIHLGVTQQVYLAHNPNRLTDAVTWQTLSLGTASAAELSRKCEQIVNRRLAEFVSVYLEGAED